MKWLLLLLSCTALFAGESEIIIKLPTKSLLEPAYAPLWGTSNLDPAVTTKHLRELHRILQFDLNYNGHTQLLSDTAERKHLASNTRWGMRPDATEWRALQVNYLVQGHVAKNKLYVRAFSAATDTHIGEYEIPLTGDLSRDRRRIHQLADTIHRASFGADGIASTRILYTVKGGTTGDGKPLSEVWMADYDGGNATPVTRDGDFCVTPQFLPPQAGKRSGSFFYVCYKTGQPKIYISSIEERAVQRFTPLRGNQLMPVISPQRDKVAFISDAGGNPDLFVQDFSPLKGAIGKPRQIFTATRAAQGSPTFSPDGSQVAFVSNKDGPPRIYLMEIPVDRSPPKAVMITRQNRENTSPAWSPDGTKIAYSSMTKGTRQIWIYEVATRQEWQLTQGTSHKENPAWGPDSLHLMFNAANPRATELYMVNLNQPKAIRITSGGGEKRFPAWEMR